MRNNQQLDGCRTVVGHLAGINKLSREIAAADGIIHCASTRADERAPVVNDDIRGTGRLINGWRKGSFVYASSTTIHGIPKGTITETTPVEALSWYDVGKIKSEALLQEASGRGQRGPGISLRTALLFSPNDRRHDRQYLAHIVEQCRLGKKFVFDSEQGLETYGSSFIGGEDFGRAFVDALSLKVAGAYNIASGFCTWRVLIETINRFAGTRADFVIRSGAVPQPDECRLAQSKTLLNVQAFSERTEFMPQQTLESILEDYIARERTQS